MCDHLALLICQRVSLGRAEISEISINLKESHHILNLNVSKPKLSVQGGFWYWLDLSYGFFPKCGRTTRKYFQQI